MLGFPQRAGGIDLKDHRFFPRFFGVVAWVGTLSPPGIALARRTPGWEFHTVQGGIDLGDRLFRPRFVGGVDVWKDS